MSRIITRAALQGRSVAELRALFHSVQHELIRSERGTQARRDALASLETISLALAQLYSAGPRL